MDLLQGLCAITAPDGQLSREFYRDTSTTVIKLCTTIATLTAERDAAVKNQIPAGCVAVCVGHNSKRGCYDHSDSIMDTKHCRVADCPLRTSEVKE